MSAPHRLAWLLLTSILCVGLLQVTLAFPASASSGGEPHGGRRNHLAGEASPYLQLHVYNPVDWYPWGEEALALARAQDKPIFLSVGYSTCYWCHVMERKVFSDPAIAALMNESFINIKVDREERPDIDEVYMQATHLLNGSGGWPNSVFLTPEGKPFFAGTYFPPVDSRGRPGFPSVLKRLATRWQTERSQVMTRAEEISRSIEQNFARSQPSATSFEPTGLLRRAVASLARGYDSQYGGFSSRTKFPQPHRLELLLTAHQRKLGGRALEMLTKTLDEMALGGIHDHLAGGFHRYSTERSWSVPHFEKMLYDNAQLLPLYARAFKATNRTLYRRVAEDIAQYLAREMTHPEGGLYSAQDAEVDAEEGASYVWTEAEIREVLGEEAATDFLSVYQLVPVHRSSTSPGALRLRLPISTPLARLKLPNEVALQDRYAASRKALLARRATRDQPLRDDKILAGWNGLAIRGLVDAGVDLERPEFVERAARAANFVLTRMRDADGRLHRSYVAGRVREAAVLDDYAFVADGLIALYAATSDEEWLASAQELADRMIADYEGPEGTGFYLSASPPRPAPGSPARPSELFVRPRVLADNVTPAGNTVALRLLRDLALLTGEERYQAAAERTQMALGGMLERAPSAVSTAVRALATGPQLPAPPARKADRAVPPKPRAPLPRGRDFVTPAIARVAGQPSQVRVTLQIADGWHVNANPPSLDFLIPTQVSLAQARSGEPAPGVVYPVGANFHPRFSLEAISVYAGTVEIAVDFKRPAPVGAQLDVTYQVCDESSCLPPETIPLAIP